MEIRLWGLWVGVALLVISVVISARRPFFLPNRLTFGGMLAGIVASAIMMLPLGVPTRGGGLLASFAAMAVAFVLLAYPWLMGGMSAGTVKMQMAFAAWVGVSLDPLRAAGFVLLACICFVLVFTCQALWGRRRHLREDEPASERLIATQPGAAIGAALAVIVGLAAGFI